MTLVPPVRSRPRRGLMCWTRISPQIPAMSPNTTSSGTTSRRFPVIGRCSPLPAGRSLVQRYPRLLQQGAAVDGHAELAVESLGGPAAHHHAGQEDLEVLQDVGDGGVDVELEGDGVLLGVDPDEGVAHGEVHPVVDVELHLAVLAHPGAVHVGLVGDVDRRRDRRDGPAELLLVVADRADHQADVLHRQAHLGEHRHGDQGGGLRVVLAADDVADVVQVAGDGGELRLPGVEAEPRQDVVGDVAHQVGVAEAVLGEAELAGELVGQGDVGLDHLVARDLVEQPQLTLGTTFGHAHSWADSWSTSSASAPSAITPGWLPSIRAEMARRLTRASVPGDSSMVTTSPSKRRMVPRMPPMVTTSSPSSSERCSDWRSFMRLRWGLMIRK